MSERLEIVITATDHASGALGSVGGALGNIGQIAAGILSAGVFMQIGREIMDLGRTALDATASWERMGLSMQSMIAREMVNTGEVWNLTEAMKKAGPASEELLHWLEALAINSPFDAEGVAQTYRQALTFGFTSEKAKELTQVLIDMSAGMGLSSFDMQRVSYALGQINQSGKLLMQDLRQLSNAGVPVNDILQKMGYSLQDVGSEAIDSKKFLEMFNQEMGGGFEGAATKQAHSWAGLLNSMEDIKKKGLREFFSSTFDVLQPYVSKFVDKFSDPKFIESLREWGQGLGDFTLKLIEFVNITVIPALYSFWDALQLIKTAISEISANEQLISFGDIVRAVMDTAAWGITKVNDLLTFLGEWWAVNGPAIMESGANLWTGFLDGLTTVGEKITPFIDDVLEKFKNWLTENGPLIAKFFAVMVDRFNNEFIPKLIILWDVIEPLLQGIFDLFLNLVKLIMQLAVGDWAGAWETVKKTVYDAATAIGGSLEALLNGISAQFGGTTFDNMLTVWKQNFEQLSLITQKIFTVLIEWIFAKLNELTTMIANTFSGVFAGLNNVVSGLDALQGKFDNLEIPDWLTPGSPTPFEIGLRGVAGAMQTVARAPFANFENTAPMTRVFGAPALSAGGSGGGGYVLNFQYAPQMSLGSEDEVRNKIAPLMLDLLREAQQNGVIR